MTDINKVNIVLNLVGTVPNNQTLNFHVDSSFRA